MKKVLMLVFAYLLVVSLGIAEAVDEQKAAPIAPAQGMPMMDHGMMGGKAMMNCPMMKEGGQGMMGGMEPMMKHHHMMNDMMQMMKSMMMIQKQALGSPSAEEKIKMQHDLTEMISKMDGMISSSNAMMMNMHRPAPEGQPKEEPKTMDHKH